MSAIKSAPLKRRAALDRDHVSSSTRPHGFRKSWPRKKAKLQRAFRREIGQILRQEQTGEGIGDVRRESARKWEVISLRESIDRKLRKRVEMIGAHKRRKAQRQARTPD